MALLAIERFNFVPNRLHAKFLTKYIATFVLYDHEVCQSFLTVIKTKNGTKELLSKFIVGFLLGNTSQSKDMLSLFSDHVVEPKVVGREFIISSLLELEASQSQNENRLIVYEYLFKMLVFDDNWVISLLDVLIVVDGESAKEIANHFLFVISNQEYADQQVIEQVI